MPFSPELGHMTFVAQSLAKGMGFLLNLSKAQGSMWEDGWPGLTVSYIREGCGGAGNGDQVPNRALVFLLSHKLLRAAVIMVLSVPHTRECRDILQVCSAS